MQIVVALVAGTLFGAGLTVAQMVNPQKVLAFLDVAAIGSGGWDPTLLAVFLGALPVMYLAYRVQRRMAAPVLADRFELPTGTRIDTPLVLGSGLFGIGWGLGGICPGPALAASAIGAGALPELMLFVASMLVGMGLVVVGRRRSAGSSLGAGR